MKITRDLSQCQDCVFYIKGDGKELCWRTGDKLLLVDKEENCSDHITAETVDMIMKRHEEAVERQKKEAQERAEREKKEEYERTHPLEYWTLSYQWENPLSYEISSYSGERSRYPVDDNVIHWVGGGDDEIIYYYSTEEKAYQKYKEVLEEYIEDAEAELLERRERLAVLKSSGLIK